MSDISLLDTVDYGLSSLEEMQRKLQTLRKKPSYWLDRLARTLLLIPAYLISLIIGESPYKIDRSAWGLPLRILAVAADALGVYAGGRLLGIW